MIIRTHVLRFVFLELGRFKERILELHTGSSEEYSNAYIAFGSMSIFRVDDQDLLTLIMPWLDGLFAQMGGLVICDYGLEDYTMEGRCIFW